MKLNSDKCKVLICGRTNQPITIKIGDFNIKEDNCVKFLGVYIDKKLDFDKHVSKLIKRANSKLTVIKRSFKYLTQTKRKMLLNSFVQSQFSYAPLVWMLHSKSLVSKINRVHKSFLSLLYNDTESSFEQLLSKENTFTIHQKNIQKVMIEMFKSKNDIGPKLLKDIFQNSNYKGPTLRKPMDLKKSNICTQKYGERSLDYFGSKIWGLIPNEIREAETLEIFKNKINKWKPDKCPCYLCREFIKGIGIVNTHN